MSLPSTERVRRFRNRQEEAGRTRLTIYLDDETRRRLNQLAGERAQATYLEALVKTAIRREWTVLESIQKCQQPWQIAPTNPTIFPGRRRTLAKR